MSGVSERTEGCVLVTGAGDGHGAAVAAHYLRAGRPVAGGDEPPPEASPVADAEDLWLPLRLDVTSAVQQRAAADRAAERFGSIGTLVTHAFVGVAEPFAEITEASWDRVLGTNLKGAMLSVQAALPHLRPGSSVVVLSSIAGRRYSSVMGAHYTVARYGLIGLVRHLAAELADRGVRINAVCPGPPNTSALLETTTPEQRARIIAGTPLRRLAEPEDVAEAVAFAAGARHVHGAVIDVNGGLY